MNTQHPLLDNSSPTSATAPRARRGDAAVVARYMQDITQFTGVESRQAAAA